MRPINNIYVALVELTSYFSLVSRVLMRPAIQPFSVSTPKDAADGVMKGVGNMLKGDTHAPNKTALSTFRYR